MQRKPRSANHVAGPSRPVSIGDVAPRQTEAGIAAFETRKAIESAQLSKAAAVADIVATAPDQPELPRQLEALIAGASADDLASLRKTLRQREDAVQERLLHRRDDELSPDWREGAYPYKNLMSRKNYERHKYRLQVELLKLQAWVKSTGQRVVILFEGRDAAGKGGAIKRFIGILYVSWMKRPKPILS